MGLLDGVMNVFKLKDDDYDDEYGYDDYDDDLEDDDDKASARKRLFPSAKKSSIEEDDDDFSDSKVAPKLSSGSGKKVVPAGKESLAIYTLSSVDLYISRALK